MRGRSRKPGNSLNRSYESNGPEVKIRGNASHIAEKYTNLARDALANSDPVMAENFFQHAEHYNRIVAVAQQNAIQQQAARNEEGQQSTSQQSTNGRGPQPEIEGAPAEASQSENREGESADTVENSPDNTNEQSGNTRPRRNTKSQAPRETEATDSGNIDGTSEAAVVATDEGSPEEVKPRSKGRRPRQKASDDMSDDASKLPDGLTSTPAKTEEPVPVDD